MSTIKYIKTTHESTDKKAKENTRRKPTTRASWILKRVLNDRPQPRRKSTEGEYNFKLSIAFVDYEKAFDSVQTQALLTSLQEQEIEDVYIELIHEIYTNSSMTVRFTKKATRSTPGEEYDRRYYIAQAIHGSTRKYIFRRLTWESRGLKIDGDYLSHLRFDILICANTPHERQQMLQELADKSENQCLKMNKSKTKIMMENDTPIYVNNTQLENVESYIYLRQVYSTRDKNKDKEMIETIWLYIYREGGRWSGHSAVSERIETSLIWFVIGSFSGWRVKTSCNKAVF